MALGDHLRAHEDVGLPRLERGERARERAPPRGLVAVETIDARPGEGGPDRLHHALRAEAGEPQVLAAAGRTGRGRPHVVSAVVAERALARAVDREGHRAVRARGLGAALAAQEARRVPAAVQQEQRLLPPLQARSHRLPQGRAQDRVASGAEHGPAVHDLHPRQALRARPAPASRGPGTCPCVRSSPTPRRAWPSRGRPARLRAVPAPPPRPGRDSAGCLPACRRSRALRPPPRGPAPAPERRARSGLPPPRAPRPPGCATTGRGAPPPRARCAARPPSPRSARRRRASAWA